MKSSKLIPVFVKKLIRAWYSPYLELRLQGNLNIFANLFKLVGEMETIQSEIILILDSTPHKSIFSFA